jgi:hypothetical protein
LSGAIELQVIDGLGQEGAICGADTFLDHRALELGKRQAYERELERLRPKRKSSGGDFYRTQGVRLGRRLMRDCFRRSRRKDASLQRQASISRSSSPI